MTRALCAGVSLPHKVPNASWCEVHDRRHDCVFLKPFVMGFSEVVACLEGTIGGLGGSSCQLAHQAGITQVQDVDVPTRSGELANPMCGVDAIGDGHEVDAQLRLLTSYGGDGSLSSLAARFLPRGISKKNFLSIAGSPSWNFFSLWESSRSASPRLDTARLDRR